MLNRILTQLIIVLVIVVTVLGVAILLKGGS